MLSLFVIYEEKRIYLFAVNVNLEMEMRSGRITGRTYKTDSITGNNLITDRNHYLIKVN